ncbi:MAG TPA: PilN domain-containing protein [Solirubrobacterales bacterium]|jgi:Tfp pilus assembly protein PilN|nr:PilN domain-containing protein [Solirubrobacterales bacterium]
MRPIDLTPEELRLGARPPMRTGPIPYIVVGALVAVLVGVALLVNTSSQVSETRDEVVQLKRENKAAEEQAQRLAAYVQFQQLRETRMQTVASLADSRFDWERVMHELALVLPHDVWLTSLDASASAGSESGEGGGAQLRGQVAGPALVLSGCATGQEAVAGFITVLKDIDGVTRVGLERSELPGEGEGSSGGGEGGGGSGGECQTREFISSFSLVVAFDAAPVPPSESGAEVAPVPSETAASTASESESSESAESAEGSEG